MRIEIKSEDRIGISQEILAMFTRLALDIQAMEVSSQFIFVHLVKNNINFDIVKQALMNLRELIIVVKLSYYRWKVVSGI